MKMKYYTAIVLVGLILGCIRDPVRYNKIIILDNQSNNNIKLNRFGTKGDSYATDNVEIQPSEKKEIFAVGGVGNVDINNNSVAYWGNQNTDSVVITFAGNVKVTHLNKQLQLTSRKNLISFNDSRNILNPKNYKVSPVGGNYNVTYTFTDQDYLNAQ